jgi:hypothetical protein
MRTGKLNHFRYQFAGAQSIAFCDLDNSETELSLPQGGHIEHLRVGCQLHQQAFRGHFTE